MKVLVYTASSFCNPQFGIQMEHAIRFYKEGHEVLFCHCAGVMSACSANISQNKAICKACKLGFKAGMKNLPKGIRVMEMASSIPKIYKRHNFTSVADIKAYHYKGVEVGFSVLSVYITKTRNPNPIMSKPFIDGVNNWIEEAINLIDAAEHLILQENPDLIVFFNGRFFDTKPFYGLALKYHLDYMTTENVGGIRAGEDYKMVSFLNNIPHNTRVVYDNTLASWEKSQKTEDEKIRIGSSFYERRRNGMRAGDYAYTSYQEKGKLPLSFNPKKKNVVIFTSSEDEFSSVSSEVDSYFIFDSQYSAIKYLAENINDDCFHFYVRIHPNMKGLDVEYHMNLYKLSSFNNVTVIEPEDPVSSYSLMDIAYNIVLFGSTIGAESLYWGKSVVLLGDADYYFWGVCSIPHKHEELVEMIKKPITYQNAKEIAIKYGYYFLENSLAEKSKYIKITPIRKKIFGRELYLFDYLRIGGSALFLYILRVAYKRLLSKAYRSINIF